MFRVQDIKVVELPSSKNDDVFGVIVGLHLAPGPAGGHLFRLESRSFTQHTYAVGMRAVPKSLEYWYMSSGVPRMASGSSCPVRKS